MSEHTNPTAGSAGSRGSGGGSYNQRQRQSRMEPRPAHPPVAHDGDEDEEYRNPGEYAPAQGGRPRRIGSDVKVADVNYKNVTLLSRFLDSRGRILSRRKTRVTAKVQRRIVQAIKRARHIALLPYTADQTRIVRKRR